MQTPSITISSPSADQTFALTMGDIATHLNAICHGDSHYVVNAFVHPAQLQSASQLIIILDEATRKKLQGLPIDVAVLGPGVTPLPGLKAYIQVERAHYALALLTQLFVPPVSAQVGIHPSALVDPTAVIDPTACVGPYVVIGKHVTLAARVMIHAHCTVEEGVSIGEGSCLHSGVRVGRDVQIGTRCIIQHNSVLGSDGFSYATPQVGSIESARQAGGQITAQNDDIVKIHSLGTLVLGDEVEIGACCTIDRATLGETRIQSGTKIDNQVQIAHNVKIGQNCLIASQTGIAGSCVIGNRVVMAGQVGVADHLQVGDDSILMAQTGVSRSVPARQVMMGTPAAPRKDTAVMIANWHRLDGMRREIRRLSQQLSALEQELSHTSKDVHQ